MDFTVLHMVAKAIDVIYSLGYYKYWLAVQGKHHSPKPVGV